MDWRANGRFATFFAGDRHNCRPPILLSSSFGWGFSLCIVEVKGMGPNPSQTDEPLDFGVESPPYAHIGEYQRALCDAGVVVRHG